MVFFMLSWNLSYYSTNTKILTKVQCLPYIHPISCIQSNLNNCTIYQCTFLSLDDNTHIQDARDKQINKQENNKWMDTRYIHEEMVHQHIKWNTNGGIFPFTCIDFNVKKMIHPKLLYCMDTAFGNYCLYDSFLIAFVFFTIGVAMKTTLMTLIFSLAFF